MVTVDFRYHRYLDILKVQIAKFANPYLRQSGPFEKVALFVSRILNFIVVQIEKEHLSTFKSQLVRAVTGLIYK